MRLARGRRVRSEDVRIRASEARRPLGRVRMALAAFSILGFGAIGTMAAFTDSASFGTTIQSGTLDLELNGNEGPITSRYQFTQLGTTTLNTTAVGYASLAVTNSGSIPLTYTMLPAMPIQETGATTSGQLIQNSIRIAIQSNPTSCDATGWASGIEAQGERNLPYVSILNRALGANQTENLCFRYRLSNAVATYTTYTGPSGIQVTIDLNFTATQA